MNLQEAIKSLQSLPPIITVTKRNLGPRYSVDVKAQDNSGAQLSVKMNRKLGAMKPVPMRLTIDGGKFRLAVERQTETVPVTDDDGNDLGYTREKALIVGLPVAMVLAEHARNAVTDAGPIVVEKSDSFTSVTFCLSAQQFHDERARHREARRRPARAPELREREPKTPKTNPAQSA